MEPDIMYQGIDWHHIDPMGLIVFFVHGNEQPVPIQDLDIFDNNRAYIVDPMRLCLTMIQILIQIQIQIPDAEMCHSWTLGLHWIQCYVLSNPGIKKEGQSIS
jgi:hypothetical protein